MHTAHLPRASLRAALASVIKAVPRRDPLPILSTVLIEEHDGAVTIRATDLDVEISAVVEGATATAGFATCLPARQLRDAEKNAPGADAAVITVDASGASVAFGPLNLRLATRAACDFPRLGAPQEPVAFSIQRTALREALAATEFAISTEETRYYLRGVFVHPSPASEPGDALRFAATDGHRLAVQTCAVRILPDFRGAIIPARTVATLLPILKAKGAPASVAVRLGPGRVEITCGTVVVVSKLVDAEYPDYGRCVPTLDRATTRATLDRRAMIDAIKSVAAIKDKRGRAIGLSFAGDALGMWASGEGGGAESTVPCEVSGDALEIGFNARYLLDILGAMSGDVVTISMQDAGAPARIEETDGAIYVLMPMRVGAFPVKPAPAPDQPEPPDVEDAPEVVEQEDDSERRAPPPPVTTTAPTPTVRATPQDASAACQPPARSGAARAMPVAEPSSAASTGAPVPLQDRPPPSFQRGRAVPGPHVDFLARAVGRAGGGQAGISPPLPDTRRDGIAPIPPTGGAWCADAPPTGAIPSPAAGPAQPRPRTVPPQGPSGGGGRISAPPALRRVVVLGSGRAVPLGTYVAAWRRVRAAPPDARFRVSPCGWPHVEETAAEILRQFRAGMDDRISRNLPWHGRGRRWGPDWQAEAARLARAVNTPRLIVRWASPEFRAKLAHRLGDAA